MIKLATEVGVDAEALSARLAIAQGGNSGTATTQAGTFWIDRDHRLHLLRPVTSNETHRATYTHVNVTVKFATKYHRVRSVHVTPTVFVNGCVSAASFVVALRTCTYLLCGVLLR